MPTAQTDELQHAQNYIFFPSTSLVSHILKILMISLLLCIQVEPTADPALSYPSPTVLRFSELGSREVKLHWTNPAKQVEQYRVVYHNAEGQNPQEVRILTLPDVHCSKFEA